MTDHHTVQIVSDSVKGVYLVMKSGRMAAVNHKTGGTLIYFLILFEGLWFE